MATLATPADIRNYATEFADLTDPKIQIYIDMADGEIDADAWGSRAKTAEIVLTCHLMKTGGALDAEGAGASGAGPVTSMSVGDVSVSYGSAMGVVAGLDPSLASSRYGLEYARLVKLAAYGAEVC